MKLYKTNKFRKIITTTEIVIFAALSVAILSKKKDTVDDNALASQTNITSEKNDEEDEDTIDVSYTTSSIVKTKPTIAPTPTIVPAPTIAPTPTPVVVPKAIFYPTPGPDFNPKLQTDKLVALTFDDGPNVKYTLKILKTLEDGNSTATFFVIGEYAKSYPDIVEEVNNSGMQIASHSNGHDDFRDLAQKKGLNDLKTTSNILKKITGKKPLLFRPPGGNYNDFVRGYVPYPMFYWAKDSNDWNSKYTDEQVIDNIMVGLNEGDIILCHDRVERTCVMLKEIIKLIHKKGYKIVSISEMYDYYDIKLENGQVYKGVKVKRKK
jgi:peptidoglycan/xylan/chitin deacetylase (PgdA/CDA1 family)